MKKKELRHVLSLPQFPLSSRYDITWLHEHEMGPCALWLTEFLVSSMSLQPGMRILDLGCGKALISIFLANEFDVNVWATDLWIDTSENWERIVSANAGDRVFPIRAEAHALPYARGFFDATVSVDSYNYYGTDEMYLAYLSSFLKPGGQIGIVVPGVKHEWTDGDKKKLRKHWEAYHHTHHGAEWWRALWERSDCVRVEIADLMPAGYDVWLLWDKTLKKAGVLKRHGDVEMLELDGENLTFTRIIARKHAVRGKK